MKAIEDRTTVVLAGAFNPAIFRPQWVAVHGLGRREGDGFQVEMLAPVGGAAPSRFSFDGLSYSAAFNGLTLYLDSADQDQCRRNVTAAANMLHQLPHTPVVGLGFNFGFLVDDSPGSLIELMATNDLMVDSFGGTPEVATRKWGNTIKWSGALVSIDCELVGTQTTISFNFHYSTTTASEAEEVLRTEDVYARHFERALEAAKVLSGQYLED